MTEERIPSFAEISERRLTDTVQIRPVECYNDFVALLQLRVQSDVIMLDQHKNEGLVVGVGPGISDGAGGRLKPSVSIGDVVIFSERNIVTAIESSRPPYNGERVIILSERSLIAKSSTKIEWKMYEG